MNIDNKPKVTIGLCPGCGSEPTEDWINGFHGWECGSFARPLPSLNQFEQSKVCAVSHWKLRAEKAEAELFAGKGAA